MFRYFLAPIIWAVTILVLSSIPSKELPDFSFWKFVGLDKLVHVAMYCIFAFLIIKACVKQQIKKRISYNAVTIAGITAIFYGAAIELFQEYALTYRHGDWLDLVANVIGTCVGILIFKWIPRNLSVKT